MNMRANYMKNKIAAMHTNMDPSMTDQSQAADTDVNVIVKKYAVTGQAPGMAKKPIYLDFTQIPDTLRGMMEKGHELRGYRAKLPEQLRELPLEALLTLTPEQIKAIVEPPKPEEPKQ